MRVCTDDCSCDVCERLSGDRAKGGNAVAFAWIGERFPGPGWLVFSDPEPRGVGRLVAM